LSRYISSFWYGENAPSHSFERFLPTGEIDLVINMRDSALRIYDPRELQNPQRLWGPVVAGAHSRHYVIDTLQQSALLGVKFRPGGAYPFLRDSADQLHNRHVVLADLWGRSALDLKEMLMEVPTPEARFHLLEEALLGRLAAARQPHAAVAYALSRFHSGGGITPMLASVTEETGLSSRRFIELFRREMGLPPKLYCRLLRFRRVLKAINSNDVPAFTRIAADCGYYDQSHLIRDFREFAGLAPSAYVAAEGAYDNQVPLIQPGQIRPIHI
jgi:AraC-like DNA-binding protein